MLDIEKTVRVCQKRYDTLITTREKKISTYNSAVEKNNIKCNEIVTATKEKFNGMNSDLKNDHEADMKELKPQIDDAQKALTKAKEMAAMLAKFNEEEQI